MPMEPGTVLRIAVAIGCRTLGESVGGICHVACEASTEAKAQEQSPTRAGVRRRAYSLPGPAMKSLSPKRKSLTSAWRPSMSSTKKTPEHYDPADSSSEETARTSGADHTAAPPASATCASAQS